MKKCLLLVSFVCTSFFCFSQLSVNTLVGTWQNELNSTLTIDKIDQSTGQISGTYELSTTSGVASKFPLVGWGNTKPKDGNKDNVIVLSFTVRWNQIGSITSWTGYLIEDKGKLTIKTLWHLARPNSDSTWDHIVTNCDVFTKK